MSDKNSQDRRQQGQTGHDRSSNGPLHAVRANEQHNHERIEHSRNHVHQLEQQTAPHGMQQQHATPPHENETAIFIDGKTYHIKSNRIVVGELRKLASPPIGKDKDLFHVVPGAGNVLMSDDQVIDINMHERDHGRHFVSALKPSVVASRHEALARKAYFIYLERGALNGHDIKDWLEAEGRA